MSKKTQINTQKATLETKNASSAIKDAIVEPSTNMMDTGGAYNIDSMKIKEDILSIFVNYSGGCNEHSFELYSNGMYAKSLPPQLSVCLKHTNNDDACRELIQQELKFNIVKLKYPGQNRLILKLGKERVTYNY